MYVLIPLIVKSQALKDTVLEKKSCNVTNTKAKS